MPHLLVRNLVFLVPRQSPGIPVSRRCLALRRGRSLQPTHSQVEASMGVNVRTRQNVQSLFSSVRSDLSVANGDLPGFFSPVRSDLPEQRATNRTPRRGCLNLKPHSMEVEAWERGVGLKVRHTIPMSPGHVLRMGAWGGRGKEGKRRYGSESFNFSHR